MKIDRIELFHVAMPLIYPWRTAYGEDEAIHSVLCRISSGSVEGWGEAAPFAAPCYSSEWAGGAFAVASQWLAPALLGKDVQSGEQLQDHLRIYKGNPFAKAALDNAWWCLYARQNNTPLHTALGATRDEVAVGADFGVMDSIDELLATMEPAVQAGFPRIKLKFRPGWDLEMLAAGAGDQYPEPTMHIDCNSGYRLTDLPLFRELEPFRLAMIEQPLAHDDLVDHAQLQSRIDTPICLDESISELRHARQAIELKSCRYMNVKPGRVGGLTRAVAIHDLCRQAGIPCWVGGMLESAVGASHCVALAMLDNFTYPADIFPSSRFYHQDLADPPLQLQPTAEGQPGVQATNDLPEPVPERLKRQTVQHRVFH